MEGNKPASSMQYTLPQSNISLGPQPTRPPFITTSQVTPFPAVNSHTYAAIPKNYQPLGPLNGRNTSYSYSGVPKQVAYPLQSSAAVGTTQIHRSGLKEPRETERRITYHPYTRTYIEYQQQIILLPVEKVRISYYQKIFETQYVPQAIESITTETVAVQKQYMKIQYIPVEQTIVHFPTNQKKITNQNAVRRVIVERPKEIIRESHLVEIEPNTLIQGGDRVLQQNLTNNNQNPQIRTLAGVISNPNNGQNADLYESEIKQSFGSQNPLTLPHQIK